MIYNKIILKWDLFYSKLHPVYLQKTIGIFFNLSLYCMVSANVSFMIFSSMMLIFEHILWFRPFIIAPVFEAPVEFFTQTLVKVRLAEQVIAFGFQWFLSIKLLKFQICNSQSLNGEFRNLWFRFWLRIAVLHAGDRSIHYYYYFFLILGKNCTVSFNNFLYYYISHQEKNLLLVPVARESGERRSTL